MAIEFLAMPDEQLEWLKGVLSQRGVWCWLRFFEANTSRIVTEARDLDPISFNTNNLMEFDLGRDDIHAPVYKKTGYGIDLDFPHSQAVQFRPSLVLEERMLTTGQLAISSKGWYEYYEVIADAVTAWYKELSRSWKKTLKEDQMVVARLEDGRIYESRYIHLTPGAIKWWEDGGLLKDISNMTFDYEVVPRMPRKKK